MLRPAALDHVGILVSDMDKALAFYRALGLEVLRVSPPRQDGTRSAVIRAGMQEINVFSGSAIAPGGARQPAGGVIDHFCLNMDAASIDQLIGDLTRAGLAIAEGPTKRRDGTTVFVHDPDGIRIELRIADRGA